MSEFDKIILENKESFDRLEPAEDGWKKVAGALPKQGGSEPSIKPYFYLKMAASIIVIVGLASVFLFDNDLGGEDVFDSGLSTASTLEELNDVTLLSPEGTPVTFDPTKNRYTLIQFWSSGSAICTEDACYYYVPAYEKYKDQGFEIMAISVDENHSEWVEAIEENQLPWTHASDLQGYESPVCVECNITSVPTTFLLNHRGDIVARDLEADELESTLDRLFMSNPIP